MQADQQAQQTAEQRAKQEKLQDEQEALPDVRAKPVKVKDVAKVQEVLAPTTVTQIEDSVGHDHRYAGSQRSGRADCNHPKPAGLDH